MKKLIIVLVIIILLGCADLQQGGVSSGSYDSLNAISRQPWQLDVDMKYLEMRVTRLETTTFNLELKIKDLESEVKELKQGY